MCAQSICVYPVCKAILTACRTSPFFESQLLTPNTNNRTKFQVQVTGSWHPYLTLHVELTWFCRFLFDWIWVLLINGVCWGLCWDDVRFYCNRVVCAASSFFARRRHHRSEGPAVKILRLLDSLPLATKIICDFQIWPQNSYPTADTSSSQNVNMADPGISQWRLTAHMYLYFILFWQTADSLNRHQIIVSFLGICHLYNFLYWGNKLVWWSYSSIFLSYVYHLFRKHQLNVVLPYPVNL